MSVEEQAELAREFVQGIVERFGLEAKTTTEISEDSIHVNVVGDHLGLLIGPRGATIEALQELTRTAVQRHGTDETGRLILDVGGYRARRAAALRQFAQKVAAEVVESGKAQALDPMPPPDRKVVHDAVNEMDGVRTTSEGEGSDRYVVVHPDLDRLTGNEIAESESSADVLPGRGTGLDQPLD